MIIGDYNPDDFVSQIHIMTIRMTYKWENPDLYQQLLTGAKSGTSWSPQVFTTTTNANDYAFRLELESPADIDGHSSPYKIIFRANKVRWQMEAEPQLAGADIVMMNVVGTVLEPDSSSQDYAQIVLQNTQSGYTWPT